MPARPLKKTMNNEIDALKGILEELSRTAEKASLTGAFEGGQSAAIRRYNLVLQRLIELDAVPNELFTPMSETASMGEIAVECRSLMGAVQGDRREAPIQNDGLRLAIKLAPFADEKDLAELIRTHLSTHARVDEGALTALAPFIGSETLGELIRALTNRSTPPTPPSPPTPRSPAAPEPPKTPTGPFSAAARNEPQIPRPAAGAASDAVVVSERREEILRLIANPHVGREQKLELAMELTALEAQE